MTNNISFNDKYKLAYLIFRKKNFSAILILVVLCPNIVPVSDTRCYITILDYQSLLANVHIFFLLINCIYMIFVFDLSFSNIKVIIRRQKLCYEIWDTLLRKLRLRECCKITQTKTHHWCELKKKKFFVNKTISV